MKTYEEIMTPVDGVEGRETDISRVRAWQILVALDRNDEWDPLGDYWVLTSPAGKEYLLRGGDDCPVAENRTSTSWLGS